MDTKSKKANLPKKIAMVAYTEYSGDPRVRRYVDALIENGSSVDCFVLKEKGLFNINNNSVSINHLPMYQYRGNSNIAYIFSYLKFFFLCLIRVSFINRKKYSIIHIHNMPDFLVFTTILNKLSGTRIILDMHDSMPELYQSKFDSIAGGFLYYLLLLQEKISCMYADIVINVHQPHQNYLVENHGLNKNKSIVICNFADSSLFNPTQYQRIVENKSDENFHLIYHGTISDRFALDIILMGLKLTLEKHKNIKLDIYGKGDGVGNLLKCIDELNIGDRVNYHGQIALHLLPKKISNADLGIVSYLYSRATDLMLPLKLLEYTAMEIPVLTVKNKAIDYYFRSGELEYYNDSDPNSFSEKLLQVINSSPKYNGMKAKTRIINKRLNWENEKIKYMQIIDKLIMDKN